MKISLQSHRTHIKKQCTPVIPAWVERETRGPWDQLQAQWEILSQKHEVEEQLGAEGKSIWCTAWWLESEPQTHSRRKWLLKAVLCPYRHAVAHINTYSNIKGWKRAIKKDTPHQRLASMFGHKHTQYKVILKGCGNTNLCSQWEWGTRIDLDESNFKVFIGNLRLV